MGSGNKEPTNTINTCLGCFKLSLYTQNFKSIVDKQTHNNAFWFLSCLET